MQWDTTRHANFTDGEPWLPVNDNYKKINVAVEERNPNSVLNHFKKMVQLRKDRPVLIYGDYELLQPEHPEIYAYTRKTDKESVLVLLNFTEKDSEIELPDTMRLHEILIDNLDGAKNEKNRIRLGPYQAIVYSIN